MFESAKAEITAEWIAERRAAMPEELLSLVAAEPGRARSYYVGLSPQKGGVRGLWADKNEAFTQLCIENKLLPGVHRSVKRTGRRGIKGWYPAGSADVQRSRSDADLRAALCELVRLEPGRGFSHYTRLPVLQGGPLGSQERKENALRALIAEGVLQLRPLPKPVRRLTAAVYPADESTV